MAQFTHLQNAAEERQVRVWAGAQVPALKTFGSGVRVLLTDPPATSQQASRVVPAHWAVREMTRRAWNPNSRRETLFDLCLSRPYLPRSCSWKVKGRGRERGVGATPGLVPMGVAA